MALLVGGGFVDGTARTVLWILVVLVVLVAMIAAGGGDWILRTGHFAERHGLIVIIALGEVVVAIGISVVDSLDDEGTRRLSSVVDSGRRTEQAPALVRRNSRAWPRCEPLPSSPCSTSTP